MCRIWLHPVKRIFPNKLFPGCWKAIIHKKLLRGKEVAKGSSEGHRLQWELQNKALCRASTCFATSTIAQLKILRFQTGKRRKYTIKARSAVKMHALTHKIPYYTGQIYTRIKVFGTKYKYWQNCAKSSQRKWICFFDFYGIFKQLFKPLQLKSVELWLYF